MWMRISWWPSDRSFRLKPSLDFECVSAEDLSSWTVTYSITREMYICFRKVHGFLTWHISLMFPGPPWRREPCADSLYLFHLVLYFSSRFLNESPDMSCTFTVTHCCAGRLFTRHTNTPGSIQRRGVCVSHILRNSRVRALHPAVAQKTAFNAYYVSRISFSKAKLFSSHLLLTFS